MRKKRTNLFSNPLTFNYRIKFKSLSNHNKAFSTIAETVLDNFAKLHCTKVLLVQKDSTFPFVLADINVCFAISVGQNCYISLTFSLRLKIIHTLSLRNSIIPYVRFKPARGLGKV